MITTSRQQLQAQDTDSEQYLTFLLGSEEYGINILKVQEIRGWSPATEIPNSPNYLLGVINLRGIVVPVIDLRIKFSLSHAGFTPSTVVIIVKITMHDEERTVGIVVDTVSDVYNISAEDVQVVPDFGSIIATEYITGLARIDEKMLILLNVDKLINIGVLQLAETDADTST